MAVFFPPQRKQFRDRSKATRSLPGEDCASQIGREIGEAQVVSNDLWMKADRLGQSFHRRVLVGNECLQPSVSADECMEEFRVRPRGVIVGWQD